MQPDFVLALHAFEHHVLARCDVSDQDVRDDLSEASILFQFLGARFPLALAFEGLQDVLGVAASDE
jgi:hypothetical protein